MRRTYTEDNTTYTLLVAGPEPEEHIESRKGKWFVNLQNEDTLISGIGWFGSLVDGIMHCISNEIEWPATIKVRRLVK